MDKVIRLEILGSAPAEPGIPEKNRVACDNGKIQDDIQDIPSVLSRKNNANGEKRIP